MPQPSGVNRLGEQLSARYRAGWAAIVAELDALRSNPRRVLRAGLRRMRRRIARILEKLDAAAGTWVEQVLPEVYVAGATTAMRAIPGAVARFAWSEDHTAAVQAIAETLYDDLLKATRHVADDVKALVRSVARAETAKAFDGLTARQASQRMAKILEQRGVGAVTYANGRLVALDDYAEMAVRTVTATAYNEGTLNGAAGEDVRWFEVFDGPDCGWTTHTDPQKALGMIVDADDARAHVIAHPRCRRAFGPRPDVENRRQAAAAERSSTEAQRLDQLAADRALAQRRARARARRRTLAS